MSRVPEDGRPASGCAADARPGWRCCHHAAERRVRGDRRRCSRSRRTPTSSSASRSRSRTSRARSTASSAGGPQTILVLGSDRRFADIKEKNPARSDTIMLVRLDPSQGRDGRHVDPARPEGRHPRPRRRTRSTPPTRSAARASRSRPIRALLHIPINHVVNVNFGGFRHAVDRLGCVYVDVDRQYFNDNNPPFGGGARLRDDRRPGRLPEALRPGRARLRALPPLRHRPRARRAPAGLPAPGQGPDRRRHASSATARSCCGSSASTRRPTSAATTAILRLLKLALESAQHPVREVHFPRRRRARPT